MSRGFKEIRELHRRRENVPPAEVFAAMVEAGDLLGPEGARPFYESLKVIVKPFLRVPSS
jgi:hypothetical protein